MTRKRKSTEGRSSKKSKGCFIFVLILFLLLLVSPILFFSWWKVVTLPVDPSNKETQIFVIPQGWGVDQIAQRLKQEGLIKNTFTFKLMAIKEGIAKDLQAGDFRLSPSMNTFEIAQALTHGSLDVWVTIPEGLRREEIAEKINTAFAKQDAPFDKQEFIQKTNNLEGFLFPDTYLISKDANLEDVIKILNDNFEKKYSSLTLNTNLTRRQIVILASLIEREAKHNKDRPIVAGILIKRLKKGMPLQVDASVQYALASVKCQVSVAAALAAGRQAGQASVKCQWWPKVRPEDLTIDSPYNTYENIGLPPTPICNPGLDFLKAATNPQDSEYWFYLSDLSGNIHYAVTNEEHEENIEEYLKGT